MATLMLRGVVSLSPVWLNFLGLAGCVYIGYAALQSLLSKTGAGTMDSGTQTRCRGSFLRTFVTGLSNPKDILFFVSFFPSSLP